MSLKDQVIALSGKFTSMTRAEATERIQEAGGSVSSSVTKATTVLVTSAGDNSKKYKDAVAAGIEIWMEDKLAATLNGISSLNDQVVAISGKLSTMTRAEATNYVQQAGGSVSSSVTKKTTILVAADGINGKKAQSASAQGVTVWTEDQFLNAIGQTTTSTDVKEEEELVVEETKPGSKKRAAKAPKKASKKAKKSVKEEEEEEDDFEDEEEMKPEPKSEPVKTESTGERRAARRPDRHLDSRAHFEIVDDYMTDLMQTNIGNNNNKFYIIQLLQSTSDKTYYVFTRWGRLGEVGQQNLKSFGHSLDKACAQFEKKFRDKTKNDWHQRHAFVKYDFQYQLVELDASETGEGGGDADAAMGKLSQSQIEKGQGVLARLKVALTGKTSGSVLAQLSGEYYSLIPTLSGRQRPPPLNTIALVEEKEALLDFWLRMGFDDMEEQDNLAPIEGIMELPLPENLAAAAGNICHSSAVKQCQSRGNELVSSNAGAPVKAMDKDLYGSIVLYTGNWIYSELNSTLRSENRSAVKRYFKYLRLFLQAMEHMPKKNQYLWRGISVDLFDQYEEGKVITWWGVSSCTSDENVARGFMNSCGGNCTLLRVRCQTAMDISVLSMYPNEKECLLAPGTQLKVLSRKRNGRIAEIEIEEVGRCI
ncbi:poly, ADP-ribose polymerase 3-like [Thraustotheca clavata]|uniref:NAD(P)(+)--arginine ADP-ribosyltransferase n=1 Tax=Thraustotheca clavata TaxID=74557 RepID=A0A1V9YSP8_9STRA|nr:poly, ADP-ribose polymerase 3-like [Thraustotheca clavata]